MVQKMTDSKTKRTIRSAYSKKARHSITFGTYTRTKQSFKDECDINNIMAKFAKTGVLEHLNTRQPDYGYATSMDFHDSMETVRKASEAFDELPSSLRSRFQNDPAQFLDFIHDPANGEELVSLGLAEPPPTPDTSEKQTPPAAPTGDSAPSSAPADPPTPGA